MLIDDTLLNTISEKAECNERLRMNFNLHDQLTSPSQRLLNALAVGTIVPIHRHTHTSETYILLRGKINIMFYDGNGNITEQFLLDPLIGHYGIQIPKFQWHSLEVIQQGSVILEVKDGPYTPLTAENIMPKY